MKVGHLVVWNLKNNYFCDRNSLTLCLNYFTKVTNHAFTMKISINATLTRQN